MNSFLIYCRACELGSKTPSNPREKLLDDIASASGPKHLNESISRIKLKGNYSKELVVQVFSELGTKVTHYTCKCERTIVHFEEASDSQ